MLRVLCKRKKQPMRSISACKEFNSHIKGECRYMPDTTCFQVGLCSNFGSANYLWVALNKLHFLFESHIPHPKMNIIEITPTS